jgi:lysophospholipase L1-like esterase
MPKFLRLFLVNALIFFSLTLALFAGFEVYYRFFYDTTDSFGLSRVTLRWFARHYQRNKQGFRDTINYPASLGRGKERITFLGDSFTAGHGVKDPEKRFVNLLRKKLGPRWEVHALARNGNDLARYFRVLKKSKKAGYQFDKVILVYVLNDISDIIPEWQKIVRQIYKDSSKPLPFLIQHSYFLNTLYHRRQASQNPNISNYYAFVKDAYSGLIWKAQQERLRMLKKRVTDYGGRFAVVTFPFLHRLGPEYDYQEVHEKLNAFWRYEKVPHLDLLPVYQGFKPGDMTVNPFDAHPNERAHQLAADAIYDFLKTAFPDAKS